jgi:N-acetylglucosamine kinase-like BadF-type ATPase
VTAEHPPATTGTTPFVVAFDGGGSKTDAVAVTIDGTVLASESGPTSSPHLVGLDGSVAVIDSLMARLVGDARPTQVSVYVSGLDLPVEVEQYAAAIAALPWATASTVVENDLFALLRAGTEERDAAAVVCGTGINAIGVRADGATARFAALGGISGDWGGGSGIGEDALWHAARDEDGRGRSTGLTPAVAAHFGLDSIAAVTEGLHLQRIPHTALASLSPVVLDVARAGDPVAIGIVERQAGEIAIMAGTALRRLDLLQRPVPVVLGGGIIRSGDERLLTTVAERLLELAPLARPVIVGEAPIVGAALLALESAGADAAAVARARRTLVATP